MLARDIGLKNLHNFIHRGLVLTAAMVGIAQQQSTVTVKNLAQQKISDSYKHM